MTSEQQDNDTASTVGPSENEPRGDVSASREEPQVQPFLDNRVIGWTFLCLLSILVLCIVLAFVYFIVVSMASPSFLNEYVKNRSDIPAQLTVTLEYESRTLKTIGVQIAFGFLVGLVFAAIGVLLFAAGANGTMQLKSSAKWLPVTLSATAPGLAVLVLGGIIIAIAVSKDISRNMLAEMNLPVSGRTRGEMKRVVSTGTHEPKEAARTGPE
jgi:hypothetical protein